MKFKLVSVFFKLSSTLKQELDKDMSRKVVGKTCRNRRYKLKK
jgi:hypothetical protein